MASSLSFTNGHGPATATASHSDGDSQLYQLVFYVPQTHTQPCLDALFAVGAGIWPNPNPKPQKDDNTAASEAATTTTASVTKTETDIDINTNINTGPFSIAEEETPKYTDSCFISSGTGQFKPSASANPHIGSAGGPVEYVQEDRVEMVVMGADTVKRAVGALRHAHPYEVASFFVFKSEIF